MYGWKSAERWFAKRRHTTVAERIPLAQPVWGSVREAMVGDEAIAKQPNPFLMFVPGGASDDEPLDAA